LSRAFNHSKGIRTPFSGVGNSTWDASICNFKALPLPRASDTLDNKSGASYSYDNIIEELISYNNIEVANMKAIWIQQLGLSSGI
jgi:chitinase